MASTPRPAPEPEELPIRHLKVADTTPAGEPARPVRPEEPTVAGVYLPSLPVGQTGELRAARAEVDRLRTEVAGLQDKLQQLKPPDATVVMTPPKRPVQQARPAVQAPPAGAPRRAPAPGAAPQARPAPSVARTAQLHPQAPSTPRPPVKPAAPAKTAGPAKPAAAKPTAAKPAAVKPAAVKPAAASEGLEVGYAAVLAEVLGVPTVSVTGNFFDDLGADSLLMARFCARVRNRPELPNVAMKEIYRTPTIATLAAAGATSAAVAPDAPAAAMADAVAAATTAVITIRPGMAQLARTTVRADLDPVTVRLQLGGAAGPVVAAQERPAPASTMSYLTCGFLQLLFLLGYPALVSYAFALGAQWVLAAVTAPDIYLRSVEVASGLFLGTALLPIAAKWLLVGRWTPTQFSVWSMRYYRFWLVKTLIRTNPMVRFVGTPLYPLYLRMLGAKIGRGALILSPTVPVCTDLLTIGAGAVIRKSSSFTGYRAYAGMIQTGPVTIGAGALVGEATVLDISSSIGDGAQLGNTSSLQTGQSVPANQRWHGSPAEPTSVDYRAVPTMPGGGVRRVTYSLIQLVVLFGIALPLGTGGLALLVREVPAVQQLLVTATATADQTPLLLDVLVISSVLLIGGMVLGLLVMATVPRLLALLVRPERVHRLYGTAYWAKRTITRLTNSKFATRVTGDSSYIVGYLQAIGYKFAKVEQTGSNFGTAVAHDDPFLCHIGSGTVVADGLTIVNADYSSNAFVVAPVRIGAHSFLGNGIFYPARSRVGNDCLLATKVMVPIDGPLRQGVGLLGSPSFEIPRSVERDSKLALGPQERRRGVAAKNRHNLISIALLLISRWVYLTLVVLLFRVALDVYAQFGEAAFAVLGVAELLVTFSYYILLDLTLRWLVALEPRGVSIYDRSFWRHERYWKVAADSYMQLLNGTPFKAGLWRALGVEVGHRLFDDGALMTERSLVTIGDHCSLNERSVVQCHSQENDAFKSDRVVIGSGVTVGVGGFIHYGTQLGDGSVLEADSFLMKGEETSPYSRWGGNPASELGQAPHWNAPHWNNASWRKS